MLLILSVMMASLPYTCLNADDPWVRPVNVITKLT